jgi:uncharacterized delta-60 repeat protein
MAVQLDHMFNQTGMVATPFLQNGGLSFAVAQAVAIQPDQKLLVVGWSGPDDLAPDDFSLARYNPDGTLDKTFAGGEQITDFGNDSNDMGYAVAIQPDGFIVVAGTSNWKFALARYDSKGNLDPHFGNHGTLTTDFGGNFDFAAGVAIQNDGKIVAAGTSSNQGGAMFALARYEPNGDADRTFGNQGLVLTPAFGKDARGFAMAIQGDGRIVVAGTSNSIDGSQFALARYKRDGGLDTSFGSNGDGTLTTKFFGTWAEAHALAIQKNGRILAGGWAQYPRGPRFFALARYLVADGSLDMGFGNGGRVLTGIRASAEANALAIQKDGKIVAAGKSWDWVPPGVFPEYDFALARYKADGSLDPIFGTGGIITTTVHDDVGHPTMGDWANSVAIQKDGKIVVVGAVTSDLGMLMENVDFAVARYS